VTGSPFKVIGITAPNSNVIVSTLENDYYAKSLDDGAFEIETEFSLGISEVKITDLNSGANKKIIVVFSSEFGELLEEDPEAKTTSYVGTITDISAGTIQIKGGNGEILQASTKEDTTYVNMLKKNVEVKESDLAIGDYIANLGFINGNKVLHSKRILITSPFVENKVEVKEITIETLSKTKLNDITLPKTWNGPEVKNMEVGQKLIVTGTTKDEKFDLRSIIVIE
jgi:hypothetical protein